MAGIVAAMLLFGTCGVLMPAAPHPFFQRGVNFTAERPAGYDPSRAAKILGVKLNLILLG